MEIILKVNQFHSVSANLFVSVDIHILNLNISVFIAAHLVAFIHFATFDDFFYGVSSCLIDDVCPNDLVVKDAEFPIQFTIVLMEEG